MNRRDLIRTALLSTIAAATGIIGASASADIGRPASPNSIAGVRRRTRRRTRRRIRRHQRLYSLPYGCSTVMYRSGAKYYYCGGIWYRPAYQGTTVIYIVDDIESGADTYVEFED
jgi:hypothetical protein